MDDVISVLEKLPDDPTLKQISENAGTVGGIIKIVLHITEKVYEAKVSVDKRLSLTLMRIMLESAKDSLPFSVANVSVEEILADKGNSEKFENIILELFDPKYNQDINKRQTIAYLPDHPVFIKFKKLLSNGITTFNRKHGYNIGIPQFLTEFNSNLVIRLQEEKTENRDLENLLHKWEINKDFENLQFYLKNARNLYFERKKVDEKSLSEYYVENKAYEVNKRTWEYDEEDIDKKVEWTLESFLTSKNSIAVIAAPFGIGKSSLMKKIAHECAIKFIENPTDPSVYIPIFVSLKDALEATSNGNSLENDLERITSYSSRNERTNILVILDGLDELPEDRPINIHNIYASIQGFIKGFPNRKFIITTRLEAGFPAKLNIKDSYTRLFSFNREQVEQFFRIYGLPTDYHVLSNMLTERKLGKPLFCWMIATVYYKSSDEERQILFDYSNYNLREIFLYQRFIHGVIFGKPKDVVKEDFEEWFKRSKDEKKALRLIAFLKNDKPLLSRNQIVNDLNELNYSLPKSSDSLISTYFSTSQDKEGTEKLEFVQKSFQEYLLAEFYLESIFNGKYHRLIGNEPSKETYDHIHGLIKFVTNGDEKIMTYAKNFVGTFYEEGIESKLKDFIKTLKTKSLEFAEQRELLPDLPEKEVHIWNFSPLGYSELQKIWVSRWLGIYVAGNLMNEQDLPDDEFLRASSFFITNNVSLVTNKILRSVNLRNIELNYANLSNADLSDAKLFHANLSNANLSNANLFNADLSNANLLNADLSNADLPYADLSNADLSYADLSYAYIADPDLSNADLSYADLSYAYIPDANLSYADLSYAYIPDANLSNANLSNANLSNANLSNANLSNANLSNANLSNANLSNANLSNANLSESLLINIKGFEDLKLNHDTRFDNSLTDIPEFIEYVKSQNYKSKVIPKIVESKEELRDQLGLRNYSDVFVRTILEYSKLTK